MKPVVWYWRRADTVRLPLDTEVLCAFVVADVWWFQRAIVPTPDGRLRSAEDGARLDATDLVAWTFIPPPDLTEPP